jgi:hypothetical protein
LCARCPFGAGRRLQAARPGADHEEVDRQSGFSSGVGLVAMAMGLLLVAVLLLFSMNEFSSGNGGVAGGGASGTRSILSTSKAQSQIKLCSEGRDSNYGDPPSAGQQAKCVRMLLGEIAGSGSTIPGGP